VNYFRLDYTAPPTEGIYWVAGTRPVIDCDASFDGSPCGVHTGESERFVSLVWLTPNQDGGIVFDGIVGSVDELDSVTHYAPLVMPAHPEEMPH